MIYVTTNDAVLIATCPLTDTRSLMVIAAFAALILAA